MSTLKKSAKSVLAIMIFSMGSKVLGFVREALIASKYGSGAETDTFFIALSAVGLFASIITQTVNTTLIPILSDVEEAEGKRGKLRHLNNFLNIITTAALLLVVFGFFFSPILMRVLGKGFEGEQFDYAVLLTRVGLPTLVGSSIVGIFTGYLESEEQFYSTAATGFPMNITYITFLLFLSQRFSITALMVTHVIAEFSKILIQLPGLKKIKYRYQWQMNLRDEYMNHIAHLIPPVLVSVAINDVNNMIDKAMSSSLVRGSVSALNYSMKLNGLVQGIFITAIITVVFPMLSREVSADNMRRFKQLLTTSLNVILLIVIPAAIGMIVLATPVVQAAYQRGSFGDRATAMTASALVFYSMGLVGTAIKLLLNRVFYALQDTKTPMKNGIYNLILNFFFNLFFVRFMGHSGLALATSITTTLTAFVLLYNLRQKIGNLGLKKTLEAAIKTLVAAGIMGVVVHFTYQFSQPFFGVGTVAELLSLLVAVGIGILVYIAFLFIFQVEELHFALDYVKEHYLKK